MSCVAGRIELKLSKRNPEPYSDKKIKYMYAVRCRMGGPLKNDFIFQAEPLHRLISESLNEGLARELPLIDIIAYEKCSKASKTAGILS